MGTLRHAGKAGNYNENKLIYSGREKRKFLRKPSMSAM